MSDGWWDSADWHAVQCLIDGRMTQVASRTPCSPLALFVEIFLAWNALVKQRKKARSHAHGTPRNSVSPAAVSQRYTDAIASGSRQ